MKSSIEVFRTNVTEPDANSILQSLGKTFPEVKFNFDLDDCDRILRAEGNYTVTDIIFALNQQGYLCELLV